MQGPAVDCDEFHLHPTYPLLYKSLLGYNPFLLYAGGVIWMVTFMDVCLWYCFLMYMLITNLIDVFICFIYVGVDDMREWLDSYDTYVLVGRKTQIQLKSKKCMYCI